MNVAIIGASEKPDRYSHRAQRMLMDHGHTTFPVSPNAKEILDRPGYASLLDIPEEEGPIDTLTVYVNPQRFEPLIDEVRELSPRRVIFNPGTESGDAAEALREAGIHVVEACTLVLLRTDQFDAA